MIAVVYTDTAGTVILAVDATATRADLLREAAIRLARISADPERYGFDPGDINQSDPISILDD